MIISLIGLKIIQAIHVFAKMEFYVDFDISNLQIQI